MSQQNLADEDIYTDENDHGDRVLVVAKGQPLPADLARAKKLAAPVENKALGYDEAIANSPSLSGAKSAEKAAADNSASKAKVNK
jgi:hypothetical protein